MSVNLKNVWDDIFFENEWGKYPGEDLIRFVARNFYGVKDREQVKILEVGSGTGANLWYIAREGFSCYGIEGSEVGVKRSIERLNTEVPGWNGDIVQGNFVRLPFENEQFDAVIDNEAIYCNSYSDSKEIFNEIHRVLKPEGKLYTRAFSTETTGFQTGEKLDYNRYITSCGPLAERGPARFNTEDDLRALLSKFEISELNCLRRGYGDSDIVSEFIVSANK